MPTKKQPEAIALETKTTGRAIVRTSLAELERIHIRLQGSWRVFDKGLAVSTSEVIYCTRKMNKLIELIEREIARGRV